MPWHHVPLVAPVRQFGEDIGLAPGAGLGGSSIRVSRGFNSYPVQRKHGCFVPTSSGHPRAYLCRCDRPKTLRFRLLFRPSGRWSP